MPHDVAAPELTSVPTADPVVAELEERVQKLEDAVSALCDLQTLEDRLYERLAERFKEHKPGAAPAAPMAILVSDPASRGAPPGNPAAAWGMVSVETLTLFGEIWQDLRTSWQMLRDPLYRISWWAKAVMLLPVLYLIGSSLAGFHNGLLGWFGYFVDLVLFLPFVYLAIKVWQRELRRFRQYQSAWQAARR